MVLLLALAGLCSCAAQVPQPNAYLPIPNPAQLKWHKSEMRMFVHFGMKTFYPNSHHLGSGTEDPNRFNPTKFEPKQWVAAAKAGGFEGIVLTTKHHDGFCLWQTQTTKHSVKSTAWRDGKADVVRQLAQACREQGLSFGLYVSIIDKNFEHAGSKKYNNYSDFYYDQIKELSTQYGPIDEYWFDGFKADKLKINYKKIAHLIRKTQPHAVIYDSGTLVKYIPDRCLAWPKHHGGVQPDQNYRQKINGVTRWYPNEASIILQGNWFHYGKPAVSLKKWKKYYLQSVGYGTTPLMNIGPNNKGLIDQATVKRLKKFKIWIDSLKQKTTPIATANHTRLNAKKFQPQNITDQDFETYHATDDKILTVNLQLTFPKKQNLAGFTLQEYITLGQRVDSYAIDCWVDGQWQEIVKAKRIGYKRIHLIDSLPATNRVRLRILSAQACPLISTFHVITK